MTGRTINVDTRFDADVIESSISGPDVMGEVVRGVIKLQDQGVRDALKALGWSDPRETADLLAIAQGQREEIKRLRKNHLFRMLQVVLYRYRAGLCKRSQTDKVDRFADRIRDALTA